VKPEQEGSVVVGILVASQTMSCLSLLSFRSGPVSGACASRYRRLVTKVKILLDSDERRCYNLSGFRGQGDESDFYESTKRSGRSLPRLCFVQLRTTQVQSIRNFAVGLDISDAKMELEIGQSRCPSHVCMR
jgi:hypothetical protein